MKTELDKAAHLINTQTISLSDASSFLGCTNKRMYALIAQGKLKACMVGAYYRIESKSLDEFTKSRAEKVA